jgi:hypothetical protein
MFKKLIGACVGLAMIGVGAAAQAQQFIFDLNVTSGRFPPGSFGGTGQIVFSASSGNNPAAVEAFSFTTSSSVPNSGLDNLFFDASSILSVSWIIDTATGQLDSFSLIAFVDTGEGTGHGLALDLVIDTLLEPFPCDQRPGNLAQASTICALFPMGRGNSVGGLPLSATPAPLNVSIDIKPGSEQNKINLCAHGLIPVAILSSQTIDAPAEVDPITVDLEGAGVKTVGADDRPLTQTRDVNRDGLADLIVKIDPENLDLESGNTEAELTGRKFDGAEFRGTRRRRRMRVKAD